MSADWLPLTNTLFISHIGGTSVLTGRDAWPRWPYKGYSLPLACYWSKNRNKTVWTESLKPTEAWAIGSQGWLVHTLTFYTLYDIKKERLYRCPLNSYPIKELMWHLFSPFSPEMKLYLLYFTKTGLYFMKKKMLKHDSTMDKLLNKLLVYSKNLVTYFLYKNIIITHIHYCAKVLSCLYFLSILLWKKEIGTVIYWSIHRKTACDIKTV